ncbi:TPA: DraP [Escherichia coli]|uniref:protein DraP n=1 Tax=Enterobacteriaceae TaxID=543 RepID=UPI00075111FE|nr:MULTISPECIES: protein DraP [Enterobacteriaceae]EEY5767551.1 DraP [Escherichia coli]EFF9251481.1 DraP [Escherichia coli]EFF9418942.1 DraP [Escherichia coli]EFK1501420.1 DraP [Escherichia coli]EHD0878429.1 DraP [Escherichia coli]
MGNLPVGSRSLYKGKKRSAGMNELRHPGSTQMTRTGQAHRGGEHWLNTGPPDWQAVE